MLRYSDSDTPSECEIDGGRERRGADGASVSSVGSSTSPPRDTERRSRRDHQDHIYQGYNNHQSNSSYRRSNMAGQRSHSAAPCESPSVHMSRSRSKSPRRATTDHHRSLSPPDGRLLDYNQQPNNNYAVTSSRFQSRSATATPTGSPKKRQLPQVPHLARALQERVAQDLEERSTRYKMRYTQYRSTGSGWERRYSGLSDSDLTTHTRTRRSLSPDRDRDPLVDFDSDMESVASVTSSAFSTQSERPRGSRVISTEYTTGSGSDRYPYGSHRTTTSRRMRHEMDHEQNLRDPLDDDRRNHRQHREGSVKRGQFTRSLSNNEAPTEEKNDGSLSDTAVGQVGGLEVPQKDIIRKDTIRRDPQAQFVGLGKKSNSTSQLSATGMCRISPNL